MLNYLRQLFGTIFEISMMYMLLDCKAKMMKYRYRAVLYVAVVVIVNAFALYKLDYNSFMKLFPLLVYVPVFLGFLFVSEFNAKKVLFVLLTVIGLCISFTSIASVLSYFFGSPNEMINIIVYVLYLPIWFLIYKFIRPLFLYMLRNSNNGWLGFCLIPLSYTVLIYTIGKFSADMVIDERMIKDSLLFFILAFSAYYMILKLFSQTREHFILQSEQDLLKTQVSAAQMHLEGLKESQEKTIIYRHDMRHHLSLIDAYLSDNNKAAAQKYIAEVGSAIEDTVVLKYCVNYTVNLILHSYISKAVSVGITVETQIDLPENSTIPDMDLCVIFANAIENATNACKRMMNPEGRRMSILCKSKDGKLFIQIANTYDGDVIFVNGKPVRTIENHGLGIKSIVAVADKYSGLCSFTTADGLFNTCIIL